VCGPFVWPERTCYAGVDRLPPGHALRADANTSRTWRFWDIDPDHRIRYADERDYTHHFLDIFKEAVRARTRTTKPIGILLSGGMDSGSVASTLGWLREHDHHTPPVHTYSWAFDELVSADERHVSDAIVSRYGLHGHGIPADDVWPLKDYPKHGPDRDDPFIRVYQPLMEHSLEAARADGVGVLLVGDHGDELVGDWVFDHLGMVASGRVRGAIHEIESHARWSGGSVRSTVRRHLLRPLRDDVRSLLGPPRSPRATTSGVPAHVRAEWAKRVQLQEVLVRPKVRPPGLNSAGSARYDRIFASGGLLDPTSLERDCSRFGLELHSPWSDRRLASFIMAVPQWMVQRPSEPKRIARHAMRGIMPADALSSAGKMEPVALFERAFADRARAVIGSLLADSQLVGRGFVEEAEVRQLFDALAERRVVRSDPWWSLTMEMWLRRYWS
ncbi:MAG: hypothetical protein H0X64_10380, partial [Gemmatimonadaceae bacterium]|nr:hypothetical protein [Gemmatimonadaceae bacterium]